MCGITGLVGCGNIQQLQQMTAIIAHRGPDDQGVQWFEKQQVGLGHQRLSIIDLSPAGHQPMTNERQNLWIVYNGEVYNYQEIRKSLEKEGVQFRSDSDTEVILKAYEQWGEASLEKLNGMFAFVIYNKDTGELFAARDRVGIKPFYYYHDKERFIFASEIKSLLASGLVNAEPDYFSLHTPTRFQISPFTGFHKIHKLPPGHFLKFQNETLEVKPYWFVQAHEETISEAEAIARLDELLLSTIRLQMIADVEVGAFLSGGLDSSLITALMAKQTNKAISTFTIKFSQEDQKYEKMPDDAYYAQMVADHFGFQHHAFEIQPDIVDLLPKMIWHLDEPLADPAAINTYLISNAAREAGITVLLNGMGGDEIFGGYRKQLACLKADAYQRWVPGMGRKVVEKVAEAVPVASKEGGFKWLRWGKRFVSFANLPPVERFLSADLSLNPLEYRALFQNGVSYWDTHFYQKQSQNFQNGNSRLSYLTQMCLNDTRIFLPEHNLTYSDKATMAASIESRPPFTDHRIIEFLFSLPPRFRIRGNEQKILLKKVAEKYLPQKIIYRPKAPFGSPLRSWIRGPLSEMVDDYLSEASLRKRDFYNVQFVRNKIKLDRDGKEDNAHLIWMLLTNELWFRTFFKS